MPSPQVTDMVSVSRRPAWLTRALRVVGSPNVQEWRLHSRAPGLIEQSVLIVSLGGALPATTDQVFTAVLPLAAVAVSSTW